MAPSTFPTNLFKIVPVAPPTPVPRALPSSDLDRKDGFIHTSTAGQIPTTTSLFFSTATEIWILKLSTKALAADGGRLVWEGPEGCVHVYVDEKVEGKVQLARLGEGTVTGVKRYERGEGEDWKSVFARPDAWLADEES